MSKSLTTKLAPLASHIYNPSPGPINCTTFLATRFIAEDPSHPLHIKTNRRLAQFDPNIFHFRVHCPIDVSKKAVIRSTVKRTFQRALVKELAQRGWAADGKVLEREERSGARSALSGAYLLNITKDPQRVLQASREEIRSEVARLVDALVVKRERPQYRPRSESQFRQSTRHGRLHAIR